MVDGQIQDLQDHLEPLEHQAYLEQFLFHLIWIVKFQLQEALYVSNVIIVSIITLQLKNVKLLILYVNRGTTKIYVYLAMMDIFWLHLEHAQHQILKLLLILHLIFLLLWILSVIYIPRKYVFNVHQELILALAVYVFK